MIGPITFNNAVKQRFNNLSNNMNLQTNTSIQTIILKILPITFIIIFAMAFKSLSKHSYCNLQGELCHEPIIKTDDKTHIITTYCKVITDNIKETETQTTPTETTPTETQNKGIEAFAGLSVALIIILFILGALAYGNIIKLSVALILSVFLIVAIVSILVDNKEEIKKGNIKYALSRGVVNFIWGIHILYLIVLVIYVIYIIGSGNIKNFLGIDFSIIVLIIIILVQTIIYSIFYHKCSGEYDYQCQSTLDVIINKLPDIKSLIKVNDSIKSETPTNTKEILKNTYKVSCVATGVHKMNVKTGQIIISVCAVIVFLVNYKDIFRTGKYLLSNKVNNDYVKGLVSVIYLAFIITLLVFSFI